MVLTSWLKCCIEISLEFLGYDTLSRKTGPFTKFCGLISAIPNKWKQTVGSAQKENQHSERSTALQLSEYTCETCQNLLAQRTFREPVASSRFCRLGVDLTNLNYKSILYTV